MDGNPMRDDLPVFDLATRARNGEKQAWDTIVERYSPLTWSICRRHQLDDADAEDVGRAVWLQLASQLADLPAPAALPGWLAATTRRECRRVLRARCGPPGDGYVPDTENIPDDDSATVECELLLAERNATLREAFTRLPPDHQRLLALLMADPPMPYAEISAMLGTSAESIGPLRSRCLDTLRRDPAITELLRAEAQAQAARTDRLR
jgi:RNA polymerase sigma factor (sigma-70 family)